MREYSLPCLGSNGFHRIAYTEWGEADNPRIVICVHGLTRNRHDFDHRDRSGGEVWSNGTAHGPFLPFGIAVVESWLAVLNAGRAGWPY